MPKLGLNPARVGFFLGGFPRRKFYWFSGGVGSAITRLRVLFLPGQFKRLGNGTARRRPVCYIEPNRVAFK